MTFRVLGSRRLARGIFMDFMRVHVLGPDGSGSVRDMVAHPGGVGVLPIDGDDVLLVRQYRVAAGGPLLEIPAGKRDVSGEDPAETAVRELEEEVGARPVSLISLGETFPSPGYTNEVIHLFAADGIVLTERRPDGAEEHHAEVIRMPLSEVVAGVRGGSIIDSKTQIAVMLWTAMRNPELLGPG
jgi:ADP-ribose pyrophosphatase